MRINVKNKFIKNLVLGLEQISLLGLSRVLLFFILSTVFAFPAAALEMPQPSVDIQKDLAQPDGHTKVELQGDEVSYAAATQTAKAKGHVVVKGQGATLYTDELSMDRSTNRAKADGHIYLETNTSQVDAKSGIYNFNEGTGTFQEARIANHPYYIQGKQLDKISENYYQMAQGFLTTCDHDVPHYRLQARQMEYYRNEKVIARGIKMYVGPVPVLYLPRYTHMLNEEPWITFVPGRTKNFGFFLLTTIRQRINPNAKLILHVDYRERKGIAEGADLKYNLPRGGSGIAKTYFINEYTYPGKHPWIKKEGQKPTKRDRYKVEWRHQFNPDDRTTILTQYMRLSDPDFIKEYFERDYRRDPNADSFFIFTRTLPVGTFSFDLEMTRVNRHSRNVDRLPEVKYDINNQEIGNSNFFIKSQNTLSNIVKKTARVDDTQKTLRVDSANELSYPIRIGFIETRPFAGTQQTYYSRTAYLDQRSVLRNTVKGGSDFSTRFFRVWNYRTDQFGLNIDKLRHVVSPSVTYIYQHRPTVGSHVLNQFDSIDNVQQMHAFRLALENKLQTKREGQTVDLLRFLLTSDFIFKDDKTSKPGLGPLVGDLEFNPNKAWTLSADATYDHKRDLFSELNFETFYHPTERWSVGLGRRYTVDSSDEYTTHLEYQINPKWKVRMLDRYDMTNSQLREEEYVLTRDLHEWEMDINYHRYRNSGTDILLVFRLKAFPDMDLNVASTGFNRRKAGSQLAP